jgi:uncharacterized protein YcaQ
VPASSTLSAREARTLAVIAQGLGRPRPKGPVTRAKVRATIDALGVLQLDAINVLERTQFLVLFSRLGPYDNEHLHKLTGPGGALFEYWGHAASLVPMAYQPLFRWRMAERASLDDPIVSMQRRRAFRGENAAYMHSILDEIRERGALTAGQLTDPRRREGEWWGRRSVGRVALEMMFETGELAGWRLPNFERVYDLPERVIPAAVLDAATPSIDDAHRELVLMSVRALGVATLADIASYFYLAVARVRAAVNELVDMGALAAVTVEGWKGPAYICADQKRAHVTRTHGTLLSPFDSLIWDRARTERLFAFFYRIEVYVPAPKRTFGYYVLPLLLGDELVGRFDVKADRKAATLRVQASHAALGVDRDAVAYAAAAELDAMRHWLGLERVTVANKGNLARVLKSATPLAR